MLAAQMRRFIADQTGATAIEYALLATIMGVALAATFTLLGGNLVTLFGAGAGGSASVMDAASATIP